LLLDEAKMTNNICRLKRRLAGHGVRLNPHLKTSKCLEISSRLMDSMTGPCTVSTLKEAEVMADFGVRHILYAVGISPHKLDRVVEIQNRGVELLIVLDSVDQAIAVREHSERSQVSFSVLIEIDADGHRSGVMPDDTHTIVRICSTILAAGSRVVGVMTHSGGSYSASDVGEIKRAAERERLGALNAAETIRSSHFPCDVVSVGSTPAAIFADNFTGVTEVRAGVFAFFDLVMAGLEVCGISDIAISVLSTVIGVQAERSRLIVDAGWMALSLDRGTSKQAIDQGYGLVCSDEGVPYEDLIVLGVNQEHAIVGPRPNSGAKLPKLSVGDRIRVLPNHACATAAQHDSYQVLAGDPKAITDSWSRFRGW
jgi:D-serine deaminase-like pyridoxal phosphate-dependent protein